VEQARAALLLVAAVVRAQAVPVAVVPAQAVPAAVVPARAALAMQAAETRATPRTDKLVG
jgi:hypothetical protein